MVILHAWLDLTRFTHSFLIFFVKLNNYKVEDVTIDFVIDFLSTKLD